MININGAQAYTLFDTGGTLDSHSPEFARATRTKAYHLENPVDLQLGTSGSRSRVSFGASGTVTLHGTAIPTYFDLANIDRYDAILGVPFMHANGIVIDVGRRKIFFQGKELDVLSEEEEKEVVLRRAAMRKRGE